MPAKVQDARREAADNADALARLLRGARIEDKEVMRSVEVCPSCGQVHHWMHDDFDQGEVNERGRLPVGYTCPTTEEPCFTQAVGRVRVLSYRLPSGSIQHIEEPRWLLEPWAADPKQDEKNLWKCSRNAVFRERKDKSVVTAPCKCNGSICPRCAHSKAARRVRGWRPFFLELRAGAGCVLVHVTMTQPADMVCEEDEDGERTVRPFRADERLPTRGRALAAVSGESLGSAQDRFRKSFTAIRDSRRTRKAFQTSVIGYVYGIEATGRSPKGRGRWHLHGHALMAIRKEALHDAVWARNVQCPCGETHLVKHSTEQDGVLRYWCPKHRRMESSERWKASLVGGSWWAWWTEEWCRLSPGSQPAGQVAHALGGGAEEVEDVLAEVLKYPFKPAELTMPQVLEWQATCKGRRMHLSGGALHPSSNLRKAAAGDLEALERLDPCLVELVEPVARAVAQKEAEEEASETNAMQMRIHEEIDAWDVATVRGAIELADLNDGIIHTRAWDEEIGGWGVARTWHIDDLVAAVTTPPPDVPPEDKPPPDA